MSVWGDWSLYRQPLREAAGALHPPHEPLSQGGLFFLPLLLANTLQTLPAPLEGFGRPCLLFRATQGVSVSFLCELSNI